MSEIQSLRSHISICSSSPKSWERLLVVLLGEAAKSSTKVAFLERCSKWNAETTGAGDHEVEEELMN